MNIFMLHVNYGYYTEGIYKGHTRPLVREGTPQRQDNKFQTQTLGNEAISGQTSTKWARYQDILTDCQP
jgi:hypothetical protein